MKNLIIILLTVGVGISLACNIGQLKRGKRDKARIEALSQQSAPGEAKIIERYIHDSIEHVVVKEVPAQTGAEKAIAVGNGYMDTITRALKVAVKQVEEVTRVNAALLAENIQLRQGSGGAQEYSDQWLRLIYHPDSNSVDLSYDVALNQVRYWKRSWLLGPKRYYNDLYASDPRVTIASVRRFTLPEARPKPWGIGVSAGYAYDPLRTDWYPYLGFGLSYNLIRF